MTFDQSVKGFRILIAAALAFFSCAGSASQAQTLEQSFRAQQRREMLEAREAERKAKLPHPISTAHQGSLMPVSNLRPLIAGKTIYLQTPFIQDGHLLRVEVAPIYFAPTGEAYSSNWAGRSWLVDGNRICFADGRSQICMTAFSDSTGQAFLLNQANLLVQVGKIVNGDQDHVKEAYERAKARQQAGETAALAVLGTLLIAAMTAPSGGGDDGSGVGPGTCSHGNINACSPSQRRQMFNDDMVEQHQIQENLQENQ